MRRVCQNLPVPFIYNWDAAAGDCVETPGDWVDWQKDLLSDCCTKQLLIPAIGRNGGLAVIWILLLACKSHTAILRRTNATRRQRRTPPRTARASPRHAADRTHACTGRHGTRRLACTVKRQGGGGRRGGGGDGSTNAARWHVRVAWTPAWAGVARAPLSHASRCRPLADATLRVWMFVQTSLWAWASARRCL